MCWSAIVSGIAVDAVARVELPLEVGGPQIVRRARRIGTVPGCTMGAAPAARAHEAVPLKRSATVLIAGQSLHARVPGREILQELRRAPAWDAPRRAARSSVGERVGDPMRTAVRRVTALARARARPRPRSARATCSRSSD